MVAVLVTGMSGTGKSTVLAELARRGLPVVDTDHGGFSIERWSAEENRSHQVWREDRIIRLLAQHAGAGPTQPLFVAGCVSNQGRFYPQFAAVVLLSAPVDVVVHRLATRGTNSYGRSQAERAAVLADLSAVEPLLRRSADAEIETCVPVTEVADRLVRIARDAG